jgi:hypothetical protein
MANELITHVDNLLKQVMQALEEDDSARAGELVEEISQNVAALAEILEQKEADAEPEPPDSEPAA